MKWGEIRKIFVLILWSVLLVASAFGWGIIYENRRSEDLRKEVYKLESKVRDQNGKITALEGRPSKH